MKSIRAKIMWLLFASVLISSLIIGSLGILLTADVIRVSTSENMRLLCKNNADKIDITFAKVEDSVNTLAHSVQSEVKDMGLLKDEEYRNQFSLNFQKNALHHIENVEGAVAIYMHYDHNYIGKTDGFFFAKYQEDGEFEYRTLTDVSAYPIGDREHAGWWYVPTVSGEATWFESYYDANLERYVVSYVVPMYHEDQLIGIIGADISAEHIVNLVKEVSIFNSGKAAVLKSDGTVLYHPNFDRGVLIGEGDPGFAGVIDKLTREDTKELISYRLKGEKRKLASCKLRNGMLMVCFAPESEIYQRQRTLMETNVLITIIVVLLASLIGIWMSRRLARPIKELTEAAKHMTDGNFEFDLEVKTKDEIGQLTTTFLETRKILQNQIHLLDKEAHRDGLTGVGNKSAFMDREAELNREIAAGNADFTIAVFDVNKLKVANDVFGHMAGDKLLLTVANYLSSVFEAENVYRLGGDEFVALFFEGDGEEKIRTCMEGMKLLSVEGYPDCSVSCACGHSRIQTGDLQLSDLLRRADKEMYKNKSETKRESFPWQEGAKGIKQLQIEKYEELLESLKSSTDDNLFLMNLETGFLRFFGENGGSFNIAEGQELSEGISILLEHVHVYDRPLLRRVLEAVLKRDTEELDVNLRMTDGERMYWVNCRGNVIKDETDSHFVLIGRFSHNVMKHLYNPITTLFNKTKMKADLQGEKKNTFGSLMLIDMDNLPEINLKHGSVYGEGLLKLLAEELERRFSMQRIYHLEKDRFAVLMNQESSEEIEQIFEEIKAVVSEKFTISAAIVPNDPYAFIAADNIYDYAVQILNDSKEQGKGRIAFFTAESFEKRLMAVELFEEFEESLKDNCKGFYLVYQPQVRGEDYALFGAEALLRYKSETKGVVYPDQFIPVLEQTGLINEVGLWVADEALRQCKEWRRFDPNFKVSVNVSSKQLEKKGSAVQIIDLLAKHELPSDALILEITESVQFGGDDYSFMALEKLRSAGIKIAIDDFGTGYSNFGNLKHIHSNILKVDRSFIRDIKANGYNYNLIYNVLEFAKANDLKVCLEGVETKEELLVLSGMKADFLQGYLFDRPCAPHDLEAKYFRSETEEFAKREREIRRLNQERRHAPVVNMEMKTIVSALDIGLWILRIDQKSRAGELYADEVMQRLLGVDGNTPADECYTHWQRLIAKEDLAEVGAMITKMANSDEVVQAEYGWMHPQKGAIRVRSSGRCTEKTKDIIVFEGFHREVSQ